MPQWDAFTIFPKKYAKIGEMGFSLHYRSKDVTYTVSASIIPHIIRPMSTM